MARVTVLMPVYNGELYLRLALDSVLSQTFADFELLVIDDGSTDSTPAILSEYAARDARLRVIRKTPNAGLVAALNQGLDLATGEYIARMDADDICFPERLAKQVAYLDEHPQVGLLGLKYIHIDQAGENVYQGEPMPPAPEPGTAGYITWKLLWMTSIQHPGALLRRAVVTQHHLRYDAAYFTAEDYDLWTRFRRHGLVERLPDALLYYRVHSGGISLLKREQQLRTHFAIVRRELHRLTGQLPAENDGWLLFRAMVPGVDLPDLYPRGDAGRAADLLLTIRAKFYGQYGSMLLPDERAQLDLNVLQGLRRLLVDARGDRRAQRTVRLHILRESPGEFLKLTGSFITHRLRRLFPQDKS